MFRKTEFSFSIPSEMLAAIGSQMFALDSEENVAELVFPPPFRLTRVAPIYFPIFIPTTKTILNCFCVRQRHLVVRRRWMEVVNSPFDLFPPLCRALPFIFLFRVWLRNLSPEKNEHCLHYCRKD